MTPTKPQLERSGAQFRPGIVVSDSGGVLFTDAAGGVHDLERERTLRPKDAAADPRLGGMSVADVLRAVRSGDLYPVLRRNARVILILDCALTDWRARQLAASQPRQVGIRPAPAAVESRPGIPRRMALTPAAWAASIGTVGASARRV